MGLTHLRLPMTFDAARLQEDMERLGPEEWLSHFNRGIYDGDWKGVALRTTPGARVPLYPDPQSKEYADTPALDRCPYIREVLGAFQCPVRFVRLLKLAAGANIKEHCDYFLGLEYGTARLHVPVQTNPEVEFVVGGERIVMSAGECWYVDFGLPHRVHNRGASDRVHLVIDCDVNPWLQGMVAAT